MKLLSSLLLSSWRGLLLGKSPAVEFVHMNHINTYLILYIGIFRYTENLLAVVAIYTNINKYKHICLTLDVFYPVSVQSLSCIRLFGTPWTAACQASLSVTNSRSLLKLTSIELVMPSSHLILHYPLLLLPSFFPSIRVFSNESALPSGDQSIGVSASASVLPKNIQD